MGSSLVAKVDTKRSSDAKGQRILRSSRAGRGSLVEALMILVIRET